MPFTPTTQDYKLNYYLVQTGMPAGTSLDTARLKYYQTKLSTTVGSINDLESKFYTSLGYTGSLMDQRSKFYKFYVPTAPATASLNDLENLFYANPPVV